MPLDWEPHIEVLRDLYLRRDKPLNYVMTVMKEKYNFIASKAQYEQQFKIWDFRKNLSRGDWHFVGHRLTKREGEGRKSKVYFNGNPLSDKKVKREVSRHVSLLSQQGFSSAPSPPAPGRILIRTPSPALVPPNPASKPNTCGLIDQDDTITTSTTWLTANLPWTKCGAFVASQAGLLYSGFSDGIFLESLYDHCFDFGAIIDHEFSQNFSSFGETQSRCSGSQVNPNEIFAESSNNLLEKEYLSQSKSGIPMGTILSILGETTSEASISPLSDTGSGAQVLPHVEAMLLEASEWDLRTSIRFLMDPSIDVAVPHLLKLVIYLISNSLLPDGQIRTFLDWFINNFSTSILVSVLQIKLPTIEAFAQKIFPTAIRIGNRCLVQNLLDAGVNVNLPLWSQLQDEEYTPLQEAFKHGELEIVRLLIARGADVNTSLTSQTPLLLGVKSDNTEVVELMLSHGAMVNRLGSHHQLTPLQQAVMHGGIPMLKLLLNSDTYVHGHYSALPMAIERNCSTRVQLLLDAGAPVDMRDPASNLTPLEMALRDKKAAIIRLLLGHNAGPPNPPLKITRERAIGARERVMGARELEFLLHEAVVSEKIDEVRRLIDLGVNVNAPDDASDPTHPLSSAVEMLNIELVKILINAKADVNRSSTFNGSSISPLGKVVEILVESKRDPDSLTDGMTIVKILIDAGANIDSFDDYFGFESTPLQAAASEGRTDLVKLLLYEGANVNALPNVRDGKTALQAAAGLSPITGKPTLPEERLRIVRHLLTAGADINAPPSYSGGMTALQAAVQSCNIVLVRLLLNKSANVNSEPAYKYGMTALQAGAAAQNLEIVQILLDAGANVNGPTSHRWGVTALQAAVRNMNTDEGLAIVRLLLSAGADINSTARSDPNTEAGRERFEPAAASHRTPLQIAAGTSQRKAVRLLLDKGANINAADGGPYYSRTALQAAASASRGDLEVVQMLLNSGANVNAPAAHRFGITALQGAASRGYIGIVFMLLKAGADINAPGASYEGRTALEAAAENGRLDVVQLLLNSNGSGISSEIRGYENAIVLAKQNGHLTVAKLLEDSGLMISLANYDGI